LVAWTSRALALLPAIGLASVAYADGDDRALSGSLGYATFSEPGKPAHNQQSTTITPDFGVTPSIMYEHAFSTDFSLRGELGGAFFSGGQNINTKNTGTTSWLGMADIGITFRFDVLKYVPYAFGGLGGEYSTGGALDNGFVPVLVVGGGLDVLQSRSRSWGLEARIVGFATDTTVFTLSLRGTLRWGYL
jgi:hypothetical protein